MRMHKTKQTKSKSLKCRHPKDKILHSTFNGDYCGVCGRKAEYYE